MKQTNAEILVSNLTRILGITPSMLAGLLQVSSTTLWRWQKIETQAELRADAKARRLVKLYDYVVFCLVNGMPCDCILNDLHEPLDSKNEDGPSVLSEIIHPKEDQ